MNLSNIVIVIPTYNPTSLLLSTIKDLNQFPELRALPKIIVNDGSTSSDEYFNQLKNDTTIFLINHNINQGKGAAIKSAIKYVVETIEDVEYIITIDSDGQHRGVDVMSVFRSIKTRGEGVHMGFRSLTRDKTPLRSFIGNAISRKIFAWVCKYELQDTQSGLRAYPKQAFGTLLALKSNRYEFEMEAIIRIIQKKIKIYETPIATVYLNKNRTSHFRPLKDSARVIWVILSTRMKK